MTYQGTTSDRSCHISWPVSLREHRVCTQARWRPRWPLLHRFMRFKGPKCTLRHRSRTSLCGSFQGERKRCAVGLRACARMPHPGRHSAARRGMAWHGIMAVQWHSIAAPCLVSSEWHPLGSLRPASARRGPRLGFTAIQRWVQPNVILDTHFQDGGGSSCCPPENLICFQVIGCCSRSPSILDRVRRGNLYFIIRWRTAGTFLHDKPDRSPQRIMCNKIENASFKHIGNKEHQVPPPFSLKSTHRFKVVLTFSGYEN